MLILSLHVDDSGVTGSDDMLEALVRHLAKHFQTKILGPIKRFLGINVRLQPDGSYHLDQVEDIDE